MYVLSHRVYTVRKKKFTTSFPTMTESPDGTVRTLLRPFLGLCRFLV